MLGRVLFCSLAALSVPFAVPVLVLLATAFAGRRFFAAFSLVLSFALVIFAHLLVLLRALRIESRVPRIVLW
jgi:hypothetical protein